MTDYIEAHKFSNNHMEKLKQDSVCGCFYCEKIFCPEEITDWIIADNDCDRLGTARCPYCGVDAVIGESSGFPVTEEFLKKMNRHWFGTGKNLIKNPLRVNQYLPEFRPLMDALWDYAVEVMSWSELRAFLEEKQKEPALGVKLGSSSGWLQYLSPEAIYASEYALINKVLCSDAGEAKHAVETFFQSEPEMSAERIYILADRNSWGCPPFLELMIGPLYGYLIGKVPSQAILYRLETALHRWQEHEHPNVLEENYWPEYELMCELAKAAQHTTFGDPDSEAAFRKVMLTAMERYARTPFQRKQYLLY